MVLPIAFCRDVIDLAEEGAVFSAQRGVDLGRLPDIELAFDAFRIGVVGRGEAAALGDHLAQGPVAGLGDACGVERAFGLLPDQAQEIDQLRIVVQHLLEMRDQPLVVRRVAGEAAGEMVVDAALAHPVERDRHGIA